MREVLRISSRLFESGTEHFNIYLFKMMKKHRCVRLFCHVRRRLQNKKMEMKYHTQIQIQNTHAHEHAHT